MKPTYLSPQNYSSTVLTLGWHFQHLKVSFEELEVGNLERRENMDDGLWTY